ncbi:hypothetical protein D2E28_23475 [Mycobacteroides abscessus]|nr:hypothetical protein D2E28_23475 [Mycobacteroides abscessus]
MGDVDGRADNGGATGLAAAVVVLPRPIVRSHLICHNSSRLTWAATDQVSIGSATIRLLKRALTCGATDQVKMRQVV